MITTANIYKAIKDRLTVDFEDVSNSIKDIKTPVAPCFYVQYISNNSSEIANETYEEKYSFAVVYFSEIKTLLDLTNIEKRLKQSLKKPLKVFYTDSGNIQHYKFLNSTVDFTPNEDDYILNCMVGFDFIQGADGDEVNNPYDEPINDMLIDVLETKFDTN